MMRMLLVGCLLSALGAGCSADFDPFYRLTTLRVLALQSEPVAPGPGETTTLAALIYTPPGADVVSRQWSWCPFPGSASDGYPCLVTESELAELGGDEVSVPPFDLGEGETAALENTFDPFLLEVLCSGTEDTPSLLDCTGGFPVQIKLTVRTEDEEVTAVRDLRLRFSDDQEPNANPTLSGIAVVIDGEEQSISDTPGPSLARDEDTVVRADVPADASETFTGIDDNGDPVPERERIIVTWFVESGDIDDERTVFIDGVVDLATALENTWTPADREEYPPETSDVVVVVRDNRNGVTWQRGVVELEDSP